jgi:molybdopterin converting factor small subunit
MAVVWIPPQMRDLTAGLESVSISGGTLHDVIARLDQRFPGIRDRLCEGDELRPGVVVAVDSQIVGGGLSNSVGEDSEVHFLPAVAGG